MKLHKVEINEKGVSLDGNTLKGVMSYNLDHPEGSDVATLTLLMDVTILPNRSNANLNSLLDKNREGTDGNFQ